MRIIASGPSIDQRVSYRDIAFHKAEVGKLPDDIFLSTDKTPPLESLKLSRPVLVDQPAVVNGKPAITEKSEHFQAKLASPVAIGVAGGLLGGFAGAVIGAFPAILTGNPVWFAAGAALGAAGGGLVGASSASGREYQLSVDEKPILEKRMTGIDTDVTAGSLKGKSGYFHRFEPRLESTNLGTYDVPSLKVVKKETV